MGTKFFNIYWINDYQFKGGQCSYKQETLCIIYSASHTKYDSYDKRNKGGQSLCVWGNRALFIFVDTTCSVCCAWAMPVYMSVKVNSGAGKERCLTSLACWDNALKTSLCIIPHRLKKCILFKGCWKHCDPGSTQAGKKQQLLTHIICYIWNKKGVHVYIVQGDIVGVAVQPSPVNFSSGITDIGWLINYQLFPLPFWSAIKNPLLVDLYYMVV